MLSLLKDSLGCLGLSYLRPHRFNTEIWQQQQSGNRFWWLQVCVPDNDVLLTLTTMFLNRDWK